jgi:hypothetical protein
LAVNLPSMWCFGSKFKPESVLRSIRSIVSLGSNGSQRSGVSATKGSAKSSTQENDSRKSLSNSTSLQTGLSSSHKQGIEMIMLSELSLNDLESGHASDEIKVTKDSKQTVEYK